MVNTGDEKSKQRVGYYDLKVKIENYAKSNRRQLLAKHCKVKKVDGKTYYCLINVDTNKEELFYCPETKRIEMFAKDGSVRDEYVCLGYNAKNEDEKTGFTTTLASGTVLYNQVPSLELFEERQPFIMSAFGYDKTDIVCLYKVNIIKKNGFPSVKIQYREPYLAHASEGRAKMLNLNKIITEGEVWNISDDGQFFKPKGWFGTGFKPEFVPDVKSFSTSTFVATKIEPKYTVTDLIEEEKEARKKEEHRKNNKREIVEQDPKLEYLRNNFKVKKMRGQPEFFLIENPETKEEKWYYYPGATRFTYKDITKGKMEKISFGVTSPIDDNGKVDMSVKTFEETDVAMMYEVELKKGEKPAIKKDKYIVIHLETLEMIECDSITRAHISKDGETMKIGKPFVGNRYEELSTRTNKHINTNVE